MKTAMKVLAGLALIVGLSVSGTSILRAEKLPGKQINLPGLSPKKNQRVQDLVQRYHQQQKKLMTLPDSVKLIKLPQELKTFCRVSDLVALTFSEDNNLSQAAFNLLQGPLNKKLSRKSVLRLLRHITSRDPKASWKALWAAVALGPNQKDGVPALIKLLEQATDPFILVHAAGALGKQKSKIKADVWRQSVEVLLRSLGNPDDTAREAHNYMPKFELWMTRWLIDHLKTADLNNPTWIHGMSLLMSSNTKSLKKPLRVLFLRALSHPRVQVRISAVVGLRDQGLLAAARNVWRRVARDKDPNVRRIVFSGLSQVKEPWIASILVIGLKDPSLDSVTESAQSLMTLGHRPASPELMAFLKRYLQDPKQARQNIHNAFQVSAAAVVKLAGLKGYDFERQYDVRGNRHMRATIIVNRDDHYRKEARRLFKWWDARGKKRRWR